MTFDTIECCYCFQMVPIAGKGNIFWHILSEHPTTYIAAAIKVELLFLEAKVSP